LAHLRRWCVRRLASVLLDEARIGARGLVDFGDHLFAGGGIRRLGLLVANDDARKKRAWRDLLNSS
jgi:hypothetical protein